MGEAHLSSRKDRLSFHSSIPPKHYYMGQIGTIEQDGRSGMPRETAMRKENPQGVHNAEEKKARAQAKLKNTSVFFARRGEMRENSGHTR